MIGKKAQYYYYYYYKQIMIPKTAGKKNLSGALALNLTQGFLLAMNLLLLEYLISVEHLMPLKVIYIFIFIFIFLFLFFKN
jgi:hypothetical protein